MWTVDKQTNRQTDSQTNYSKQERERLSSVNFRFMINFFLFSFFFLLFCLPTGGQCWPGTYCPSGSGYPEPCTEGKYCREWGRSLPNGDCNAGRYSEKATIWHPNWLFFEKHGVQKLQYFCLFVYSIFILDISFNTKYWSPKRSRLKHYCILHHMYLKCTKVYEIYLQYVYIIYTVIT